MTQSNGDAEHVHVCVAVFVDSHHTGLGASSPHPRSQLIGQRMEDRIGKALRCSMETIQGHVFILNVQERIEIEVAQQLRCMSALQGGRDEQVHGLVLSAYKQAGNVLAERHGARQESEGRQYSA